VWVCCTRLTDVSSDHRDCDSNAAEIGRLLGVAASGVGAGRWQVEITVVGVRLE
jgi:hypothetical protein